MTPNFDKSEQSVGLIPVIVQDHITAKVLMLGYMNEAAYIKTQKEGRVTFYSRSKQRLWTKGESSGNFLEVEDILLDCDEDTLLIKARPLGPTCHKGDDTCFQEENKTNRDLGFLEDVIQSRKEGADENSYTAKLLAKGINKVAQKVGEEAVELVIEAKDDDKDLFLNEAADLMYHYLVLLAAKDHQLSEVVDVLRGRHNKG